MEIDWLTVGAQIVNFLILVWLLQHFLYGPITRAMDQREQRISDRLREADDRRIAAEEEAGRYRDKARDLDQRRVEILARAQDDAEELRRSLESKARDEVNEDRRRWRQDVQREREDFLHELRRQASEGFSALARRALRDLADAGLEERMAEVFIARLEKLDRGTRHKIAAACREADGRLVVRSTYDLAGPVKGRITRTVHELLGEEVEVDYQTGETLSCGIEMRAGSQTVLWTLDSYLDGLEDRIGRLLGKNADGRLPATA